MWVRSTCPAWHCKSVSDMERNWDTIRNESLGEEKELTTRNENGNNNTQS